MISLCVIVGNVENYIERFLKHFKPLADEIIIVRAIGSATPDRTLEICEREGCKTFIYENEPQFKEWPHVDNFARARNFSFSKATGTWCVWADTDDIIDEHSVSNLRKLAQESTADYILVPYVVRNNNITFPRERMLRRGVGEWHRPVHEHWKPFTSTNGIELKLSEAAIDHAPLLNKEGSHERNLTILKGASQTDNQSLYFLHQEYLGLKRIDEAVEAGKAYLALKDADPCSRYEVLMNMAQAAVDPRVKQQLLLNAFTIQPERREALGLLCATALDVGDNKRATAFARMMFALPVPNPKPWTHRDAVYGWAGFCLYTQCLRVSGEVAKAEELERKVFMDAGGKITLVHATRKRPIEASLTRKLWLETAFRPEQVEHLFVIDSDDYESIDILSRFRHIIVPAGGGCVAAFNAGCKAALGKVLFPLSDDFRPPFNWDSETLARIGDIDQPATLAMSDGTRTDALIGIFAMTKARHNQKGYLQHPRFKSMYADTHMTHEEYRDGVVIEARDFVIEHMHPMFGKAEDDETYKITNSVERYEEGKRIFDELIAAETVDTQSKS